MPQWPCFFNTHVPFQPRSVAEAEAEMQSGEEDKQGELQDDSRDLQAESRFQPRARARSTSGGFGLGADEDGYVTNGASTTANGKRKSSQSPRGQRGKKHRRRPSSPKSFWATVLGWSPQLLRQRSRQALELPSLSPTPHRFTGTRRLTLEPCDAHLREDRWDSSGPCEEGSAWQALVTQTRQSISPPSGWWRRRRCGWRSRRRCWQTARADAQPA